MRLRLLPLSIVASFHSDRMAKHTMTRLSRTFNLIPKFGPEGFLLRFLIPGDHWYSGRERSEGIRRANRSSRTEVKHRQCKGHGEAGQTNNARDDEDQPFHERSDSRTHIRILVGINSTSVSVSQRTICSFSVPATVAASESFQQRNLGIPRKVLVAILYEG